MAAPATLMRSVFAGLVLFVSTVAGYSGEGTAYGGPGGRGAGACEIRSNLGRFENYYAAMNHAQYGGSCGKCIRVCGKAGCVVLMVVDLCPGCSHGDVDMSSNALRESTGFSWDRKPISWDYVSCGSGASASSAGGKKGGKKGGKSKNKGKSCMKKCKCRSGRRGRKCRSKCRRRCNRNL